MCASQIGEAADILPPAEGYFATDVITSTGLMRRLSPDYSNNSVAIY